VVAAGVVGVLGAFAPEIELDLDALLFGFKHLELHFPLPQHYRAWLQKALLSTPNDPKPRINSN
jgi:hypothetical protein